MPKNKLCLLITGLSYGGAENQLLSTALVLKKRGWDVHVISMCPPRAYTAELAAENIPVYSLDMRRKLPDPRALFRFASLLRKIRPDVLHSHMIHANIFARTARILCRIPVLVCTAHNIYEGKKWREYAYRYTDRFCDLTTNVCHAGAARAIAIRTVPQAKIKYMPNGVDVQRFSPDGLVRSKARAEMALDGKFVFLAVGRYEEQKDYPNMLRAFALVYKEDPTVVLLLAGDGVLKSKMEVLARTLDLANNVRFLGIRRDVPDLMNAADSYVMSSAWEGMPMVLLEAAAMGLPIVTTDVGGNGDVVLNGLNGILVPARDAVKLAEAMTTLKNASEEELMAMRKAAIEQIADNYDIEKVVDRWEQHYETLLTGKIEKI